jgi:hypothetical protein
MHRYYLKIIFGLLVILLLQQQQLNVYKRKTKRPRINDLDRLFWILARKVHANWRSFLQMVQPATVIAWHRKLAAYLHTLKSQKWKKKRFNPTGSQTTHHSNGL